MYKTLSNGYKMPLLGLGTYKLVDEQKAYEAVKYALEVGYRLFDTAQLYQNEHIIGKAIKDSNVDRKELFITSKLIGHDEDHIVYDSILESLKKLNTDYLDLLLIHWPSHDNETNIKTWRVFERLYKEGKVKAIGVSNFSRYQLNELLNAIDIKPMINQVELHPGLNQTPLKKYLDERNIAIQSYGPLMRGHLEEEPFKSTLSKIADKYNATIAQVVIAWGLNKGILMIPKSETKSRILENFNAHKIILDNDDILTIDSLNNGKRYYGDPSNNIMGSYKTKDYLNK